MATIRALKLHGGVKLDEVQEENVEAVEKGFPNLKKHIENLRIFGVPFVVALNHFSSDTKEEVERFIQLCHEEKARVALSNVWAEGGKGGTELAKEKSSS